MHLVLRSSGAKGEFSFRRPNHARAILDFGNRFAYVPFIRAVTTAIAMAVTGRTRWAKSKFQGKFWDYRPFTRAIKSYRDYLNVNDYIQVNKWEGEGKDRTHAVYFIRRTREVPDEMETWKAQAIRDSA